MNAGIFDRNGHLTELGLDRIALEPETLSTEIITRTETHLAACAVCASAQAAIRADDATFAIAPRVPEAPGNIIPFSTNAPSRTRRTWAALGSVVLLAAVVLFAVRFSVVAPPTGSDDGIRTKGDAGFTFHVHIHDGTAPVMATHNDFPVRPGDRMGFTMANDKAGYLLVTGRDDAGQAYICFPQPSAVAIKTDAAPMEAHPTPFQIQAAMAFDAVPGREHVAAVFCELPFGSNDLPAEPCAVARDGLIDIGAQSCAIECLTLSKGAPRTTPEAP